MSESNWPLFLEQYCSLLHNVLNVTRVGSSCAFYIRFSRRAKKDVAFRRIALYSKHVNVGKLLGSNKPNVPPRSRGIVASLSDRFHPTTDFSKLNVKNDTTNVG